MPKGKKKGKGKGKKKEKGKGKGKRKGNQAGGKGEDGETKKLLRTYERNCIQTNSRMCPGIRKLLKSAAEEDRLVTKFILESVPIENEGDLPVLFDPLITSLRQERYKHVQDIHVWDYAMTFEDVATLALFLEKDFYPIRVLELLDCLIDAPAMSRLVRPFRECDYLTTLILDYNEFGDEGCRNLCAGLAANKSVLSLSLCYCDLHVNSGMYLGQTVSTTAIRELYLDGNELQCEGVIELIRLCVDQAEIEAYQREEAAKKIAEEESIIKEQDTKKKRRKKKKEQKGPPPIGPWIHKLHLADNGIDGYGDGGSFAPVICMRLIRLMLMNSKCLEELDLEDNPIGELGGREILDGLKYRKELKLGGCKVRTTHRLTPPTFTSIVKLSSQLMKKGRRKRMKGKKKRK